MQAIKDVTIHRTHHANIFYFYIFRDVQLTNNGLPGVFYNGIPDWVFEEEVLEGNEALWWSPDSSKLVRYVRIGYPS